MNMRRILTCLVPFCLAASAAAQVTTKLIASGLTRPLWAGAPDGDERVFIAVKGGQIRIVENGQLLTTPFLNLVGLVSTGSEQGLLGVAFHPNYATNGFFYVNYTDGGGDIIHLRGAAQVACVQRGVGGD